MIITTTINDKPIMVETYLEDDGDGFPVLGQVKDLWGKDLDLNDEDEKQVLTDAKDYIEDGFGESRWSSLEEWTGS
jgi:hypothetical protein